METKNVVSLLEKLKIQYPIIQAPMAGGATTPELISAVSNAGGLGSMGAAYLTPETIQSEIKNVRKLTKKPFSINLFVPQDVKIEQKKLNDMKVFLNDYRQKLGLSSFTLEENIEIENEKMFYEQIDVLLEEKISIVSFTFGIPPAHIIQALKSANIIIMGTATTVQEGLLLEQAGCDMVIAQGSEAGGHRGTFKEKISLIGSMALIPQMVDALNVPVVAAGGIMDGRGVAAALSLGAAGAQMGTAFLTCYESGIHPLYKKAILNSNEESTVITSVFSGKPARGINSQFIKEFEKYKQSIPDFPLQNELTKDIRKKAAEQDNIDYMSLWSGQGTRLSKTLSAKQLIQDIVNNTRKILE